MSPAMHPSPYHLYRFVCPRSPPPSPHSRNMPSRGCLSRCERLITPRATSPEGRGTSTHRAWRSTEGPGTSTGRAWRSTKRRGTSPGSSVEVHAETGDVPGPSVEVHAETGDVPGSSVEVHGGGEGAGRSEHVLVEDTRRAASRSAEVRQRAARLRLPAVRAQTHCPGAAASPDAPPRSPCPPAWPRWRSASRSRRCPSPPASPPCRECGRACGGPGGGPSPAASGCTSPRPRSTSWLSGRSTTFNPGTRPSNARG